MKILVTQEFERLFKRLPKEIQRKASKKTEIFRLVFVFIRHNLVEFRFIGHHNQIYNYNLFAYTYL